jgi:carbamoyltransferase
MSVQLGIHGGYTVQQHDAAAVLMIDGRVVIAVEEERLYRQKGAYGLVPVESIAACLREAQIRIEEVDLVTMPGSTYRDAPDRASKWVTHHFGWSPEIRTINHQEAHLHSAFWQSGFADALCISFDAYGDQLSGAIAIASLDEGLTVLETRPFDNSLGTFYGTMTSFLGFKPGEDEFKVMGLAAYGQADSDLSFFLRTASDGYICDPKYARDESKASQWEPFYSDALVARLGAPRRREEILTDRFKNLAASTQLALETAVINLVQYAVSLLPDEHPARSNLCLSGGVALNCSANGRLFKSQIVRNIFVAPAASDRGLALGCAFSAAHHAGETITPPASQSLGPSRSAELIEEAIRITGVTARTVDDPAGVGAAIVESGRILGWFQGRSEYGPRALGNRSILADPKRRTMKEEINARVKFREEFRPFAPAVTEEAAGKYFDMDGRPSPFMTVAFDVNQGMGDVLPAVTHVNGTARVQTVSSATDGLFYDLVAKMGELCGHPAVVNTSFNVKGQPIVETPLDALATFAATGMDALILGPYLIDKKGL